MFSLSGRRQSILKIWCHGNVNYLGEELNNSVLLVKLNVIQLLNNTGEEFSFFRFVK